MKKLGKNLVNTSQTIEAYACRCSVSSCYCTRQCYGNGTANAAVDQSKRASMSRAVGNAMSAYIY